VNGTGSQLCTLMGSGVSSVEPVISTCTCFSQYENTYSVTLGSLVSLEEIITPHFQKTHYYIDL